MIAFLFSLITGPAAIFYLFVVPMLVASRTFEPNALSIIFGLFLYLQLWMLVSEYAFNAAASLYGFSRKSLFGFLVFPSRLRKEMEDGVFGRVHTLMASFLSFAFTIYGFAIAYVFVSNIDEKAFNVGKLDIVSGIYFSMVTIATVGYGDIAPVTHLARLLVVFEIFVGIIYATFFFSIIASFVRER